MFLISFAGIASVLSQESLNAMTVSISVFLLLLYYSRLSNSGYISPMAALIWERNNDSGGRAPGSMLAGILIFVLASSIVLIASRTIFIKKDIAC